MKMQRVGLAMTVAAVGAFAVLGVAFAQSGSANDSRGWSQMMMGPMAGCPMGAGHQGMMGAYMMGPQARGPGAMHQGMMGSGPRGWGGKWPADISPQLDAMRAKLAIRPPQKEAWDAYVATARADAQSMSAMHVRMMAFMQAKTASALDWLRVHRDMMSARANSLEALTGATERLYGQLDATQKASFDQYGGGMCGAW